MQQGLILYGSVAVWSKALDLGFSHFDGVGSYPTATSNFRDIWCQNQTAG